MKTYSNKVGPQNSILAYFLSGFLAVPSLLDLLFFFLDWFLELNFLDPYLGVFAGLFLDDGGDLDLERDREGDLDWDFLLDPCGSDLLHWELQETTAFFRTESFFVAPVRAERSFLSPAIN